MHDDANHDDDTRRAKPGLAAPVHAGQDDNPATVDNGTGLPGTSDPTRQPAAGASSEPTDDDIRAALGGDVGALQQLAHWLPSQLSPVARPRRCYYILRSFYVADRGYIPVSVTENRAGYQPMTGQGECAAPWYWGLKFATAESVCSDANAKLGLTSVDVREIVRTALAASRLEEPSHSPR